MSNESDIRHIIAKLGRSIEGRDFDAAAGCFAEDAVLLLPRHPVVRGVAAIRAALAGMFAAGSPGTEVMVLRVEIAGSNDLAYAWGSGVTHSDPPLRSKWIAVFRRQAGEWRIAADTFNEDAA